MFISRARYEQQILSAKLEERARLIRILEEMKGKAGKVKNQPPDLTAGEFNRGE